MMKRLANGRGLSARWGAAAAVLFGLLTGPGCSPDVGPALPPGAGKGVRAQGAEPAKVKGKVVDEGSMKKRNKSPN